MVSRFEELEAWKLGRVLTKEIFGLCSKGKLAKEFALKDQLKRASLSITSNIAEGFERDSNKEFVYFLAIAKGSSGEVRSLLYTALDTQCIDPTQHQQLHKKTMRISHMLSALITHLKASPLKGRRHR